MPESAPGSDNRGRPFVGVHLRCCNVYVRAYVNADRTAFVGWCPRCAAPVRIEIVNEGGSRSRFFAEVFTPGGTSIRASR